MNGHELFWWHDEIVAQLVGLMNEKASFSSLQRSKWT